MADYFYIRFIFKWCAELNGFFGVFVCLFAPSDCDKCFINVHIDTRASVHALRRAQTNQCEYYSSCR